MLFIMTSYDLTDEVHLTFDKDGKVRYIAGMYIK